MSVTIIHPQAHLLAPASSFYAQIVSGDWGAAAYLVDEQLQALTDVDACARALDELFAASSYRTSPIEPVAVQLQEGSITFDAERAEVTEMIDLFMRVLIGQWREIDWVTRLGAQIDNYQDSSRTGELLGQVRHRFQRPDAYPDHPGASWGIHNPQCGAAALLAYPVWKKLDNRVDGVLSLMFAGVEPEVLITASA